jgi:hypothetical protein
VKPEPDATLEWLATDPPLDEVVAAQAAFTKRANSAIKRAELGMLQKFLEVDLYPEQHDA